MLTITHPVNLRDIQRTMTEFVGYGGIKVTTNRASFGHVEVESVLDGSATAVEVVATSDGRGFIREWAPNDGNAVCGDVYVEVYSAQGREFHGWIDRVSRKIVQAG